MAQATGEFEVKIVPLSLDDKAADANLGRMSIDKQFHGDLEAVSKGEMLAARTAMKDSAGYVAIERVTGNLHGRSGSFVLQHSSTMSRGEPHQSIIVVPDSATDQLAGLTGMMTINVENKKHSYVFDYSLPKLP